MNRKLEKIVKEVVKNKIPITGVEIVGKSLAFEILGFSKSGHALVYEKDGKILCETRYNTIDEIEDFRDLVSVAYDWETNYLDREPFTAYSSTWKPCFEKYGML